MGVYTFTVVEKTSDVTPARFFKASCLDNHKILPKVMPQTFKNVEFVEGDSTSVGCVKKFNFVEGLPYKYFKTKNLELDIENCYVKYTTFEGDALGDKVESVVYEAKIAPNGNYKMVAHFHSKGDVVINEEDVKGNLQRMVKSLEAVEQYLINNPQAYA